MNTRITELFSIDVPVISGGMVWCSGWELAAAVSNQGGLGLLGAGSMTPELLVEHIRKTKQATTKPFGVNIPLMNPNSAAHIEKVIEEKVPVVFTSAGNPALYTQKLKDNGIKVVHVVANEKFALKAQSAGCDAIVAEGFEAGGHNGKEETTTLVLIQQIANAVEIPVIAAGGIASGEQLFAMLSLGAEGVQIGSAFAVSKESSAHDNFKQAVIASKEGDTMLFFRKLSPTRLLKGGFFESVAKAEAEGASKEELLQLIGIGRSRIGMFEGDLQEGELEIGQVASLLNELKSVKEIFEDLKQGFEKASRRMMNIKY
jgi:enoyl-[acyl-carrier protein] reductase II